MNQLCRDAFTKAILGVREEFMANPLRFFSEKDIHWFFCRKLEEELVSSGVQERLDQLWPTAIEGLSTSLIHQEYGVHERTGERYDICLLSPEDIVRIDGYDLTIDRRYVRPLAIVEYTTERYGGFSKKKAGIGKGDWVDKFREDIRKLSRSGTQDAYAETLYRVTSSSERRAKRHTERFTSRIAFVLQKAQEESPSVSVSVLMHFLYSGECKRLTGE